MRPELLSPAGSPEALRAAVQNGAGAVYLGWGAFNARRGAKNFSDQEFADALVYCHERGVRVFLTLNTLVTDRELPSALETARKAARLGVDSVLVQDWGLFDLLRRAYLEARYNDKFVVTKADIDALVPKIELLRNIVEKVCKERIAEYGCLMKK